MGPRLDDDPELVGIEVYVTSARRAYALADRYRARGAHVVLGGLHVTSCPEEAAATPTPSSSAGGEAWPRFLADFRAGAGTRPSTDRRCGPSRGLPRVAPRPHPARSLPRPQLARGLARVPARLRLLLQGRLLRGRTLLLRAAGRGRARGDRAAAGRHLYFLDDHLFGHPAFAAALFDGMRGMGRALASRGDGGRGAASRPPRARGRLRPAQPVCRLRDARRRGTARAGQAQNRAGTTGRRSVAFTTWRHGERQLRVRLRRGRRPPSSSGRWSGRSGRESRPRRSTC